MNFEFGLGHRDGSVDGPFPTEEEMYENLTRKFGTPLARYRSGPWYDLDPVNGLCYCSPIYKKS